MQARQKTLHDPFRHDLDTTEAGDFSRIEEV